MKTIKDSCRLLFLVFFLNVQFSFAQTVTDLSFKALRADMVAVDLDNDGDLDLVASGSSINSDAVNNKIYLNDGLGNLTELTFSSAVPNYLVAGDRACLSFADYDGDGILDVLMGGRNARGILKGNGDGTFTQTSLVVPSAFVGCSWINANSDGYIDYIAIADGLAAITLYTNNGDGTFTASNSDFINENLYETDLAVTDYNNDRQPDLFISAWDDAKSYRFSRVFENNSGSFTKINTGIKYQKANGSATWADVDGNGYLDLLFSGDGGSSSEETADNIVRIMLNNGDTLIEKQSFEGFRPLNTGGSEAMVDWDNDGDMDIILTGWSSIANNQVTKIYLNDGQANFTLSSESIPGVSDGGVSLTDIDGDGRIDLFAHGYSADRGGWASFIYKNGTEKANTKPSLPINLTVTQSNDSVILSWDAATDNETPSASLSYAVYLKNVDSAEYHISPAAIIGGANDGKRKLLSLGNAFLNKSWVVTGLANGSYEWGVQAIDGAYAGSSFATGSFTLPIDADDTEAPQITAMPGQQQIIAGYNCSAELPDYTSYVTATDNKDTDVAVSQSPVAGTVISGDNTITIKATDNSGNFVESTFEVIVIDTTRPSILNVLTDTIIGAGENCIAEMPDLATALATYDNCDDDLTITQSQVTGTTISGTQLVTLTVMDDAGNYTQATLNVIVKDKTAPVILTELKDTTILSDSNGEVTLPDFTANVLASDNCSASLTISQNPEAGTTISGNSNLVTISVQDEEGNQVDSSFNVVVSNGTGISGDLQNTLRVYPNPFNSSIHISANSEINTVRIFDNSGRLVLEKNFNESDIQLDVDKLKSGSYIIIIIGQNQIMQKQIVKY